MKFDWYQATIEDNPVRVLDRISSLGHAVIPNDRVGKMYRFTQGFEVHHNQKGVVARLACNGEESVAHAWATSDDADDFASLVRENWPNRHLVTRLDSCQDFIDKTAFQRLRKVGRRVAKDHRVSFPAIQDELNPTAGRTQYMGSPSSEYRARIYDKGWEVVGKLIGQSRLRNKITPEAFDSIRVPGLNRECHPSEWVRCELQARPKEEEGRRSAAVATPEEVWTFTSWAQQMAKDALALDLERFYVRQRRYTTDEKALRWMCRQYANMLCRLHGDLGDWACVGNQIGDTLADLAAEDARTR